MNTEIIVAVTALLATTLGATITSIAGIADRRLNQKNNRKEKYEPVIRIILSEYFPRIDGGFYIAKNYKTGKQIEINTIEMEILDEIGALYEEKIINELPLDILDEMADLNFSLGLMRIEIKADLNGHKDIDANFRNEVETAEIKFKELKKKIKKIYI